MPASAFLVAMSSISTSPASTATLRTPKGSFDHVGIFLSSACAVHCVLMPFVVGGLAFFGHGWVASDSVEALLLGSAFVVALGSLVPSYRKHKNPTALALFAVGLALILGAQVAGLAHGLLFGAIMGCGGTMIALAHYRNHRLCTCCGVHRHHHSH